MRRGILGRDPGPGSWAGSREPGAGSREPGAGSRGPWAQGSRGAERPREECRPAVRRQPPRSENPSTTPAETVTFPGVRSPSPPSTACPRWLR
ncbi:hypothetical protein GTW41_11050 [Streptomyces sp. SID4941]|nr:hypothetical protein [Streptomyces sp. SID4941]